MTRSVSAVFLGAALVGCLPRAHRATAHELRDATAVEALAVDTRDETPADVDLEGDVELPALVALVLARSPELAARAHAVRSIVDEARADGALPEPQLYVEVWNAPLTRPYALRQADMIMVGVNQSLPPPGVRAARTEARLAEARAALAEMRGLELELTERVGMLYADYVGATLEHRATLGHLALLDAMRGAALARFGAGAGLGEVARIDVERSAVVRGRFRVEAERARVVGELNALLARPAHAPIGPPAAARVGTFDAASLDERAVEGRASAVVARERADAGRARARTARLEARRPSFMFSVAWYQMPEARAGVGGMVTMSLPWLSRGPSARADAASEAAARDEADALAQERLAIGEARAAFARLEGLEAGLGALRDGSVAAIERVLGTMPAGYASGSASLLDWIDVSRQLLDVRIEEARLVAELGRAVATLERALGIRLGDTRAGDAP